MLDSQDKLQVPLLLQLWNLFGRQGSVVCEGSRLPEELGSYRGRGALIILPGSHSSPTGSPAGKGRGSSCDQVTSAFVPRAEACWLALV